MNPSDKVVIQLELPAEVAEKLAKATGRGESFSLRIGERSFVACNAAFVACNAAFTTERVAFLACNAAFTPLEKS